MISLEVGDCRLEIDPARGGAITAFDWRGLPIFRPACGPSMLDTACFALIPFSNRIAHGRFNASGHHVQLSPNFPGSDHPHPLHGFGWLSAWRTVLSNKDTALLEHCYNDGEWPWPYAARQHFILTEDSLTIHLSIRNLSGTPMPCGLGLHPYFPCNDQTRLRALHKAEVIVDAECLPVGANASAEPRDWWDGAPAASREVDTAYLNRTGAISIQWPDKGAELVIEPSDHLAHTVIYTPAGEGFFCVEPVSHATNSFNASVADPYGHIMLAPDAEDTVSCLFSLRTIP